MKRSKIYAAASVLALALIAASCEVHLTEDPYEQEQILGETAMLNLCLVQNHATKSSITPDEDAVTGLCVMAYRKSDGRLMAVQKGKNADEIGLELIKGEYNIYVTANMEGFEAPADEKDMTEAGYLLKTFSDIGNALPMCWKGSATMKAGERTTVPVQLSRLVSKVSFRVEMGVLEGLEITSVQLKQGAGHIRPFMEGGSRIMSETEAMDGDSATEADIRKLMGGESMHFYVTENCQGQLMKGNTDPWEKIPARIGDASDLCTYIEMTGKWDDDAVYAGTVTYRFYLGEDATTDFNVRRNSIHNLTLYLEEESFDRISWKIDASQMELVQWEAVTSFSNNFHTPDNFYVTENILIEFTLDQRGQKYWKKRENAFTLCGMDSKGNTVIRFNEATDLGEGRFEAMGTCLTAGDYDVIMINDETGETEYVLGNGTVHVPEIAASYDDIFTEDPVDAFKTESGFDINGTSQDICLYLTDKDGFNLNQGHFYGCDLSLCEWDTTILNDAFGHDLSKNTTIETFYGECMDDSYAVMYRVRFENQGTDKIWNRMLTESLGKGVIRLSFKERFSGAEGSHGLGLYCDPVSISFREMSAQHKVQSGMEFMYVVDNPSNLPILIGGLRLNTMRSDVTLDEDLMPVLCEPVKDMTETTPIVITRMPHVLCSRESGAQYSFTYNNMTAYAAADDDIEQHDIPDQTALFHTFDVRLVYPTAGWTPGVRGDYYLDKTIYGSGYGAYMNCGVIFHSYGNRQEIYDSQNGEKIDFRNYGDLLGKDAIEKFNDIAEITLSINEDNELVAVASHDVELEISISGYLKGRTRCVSADESTYKIWGHHFEGGHQFFSTKRLKISTDPVAVDRGKIAESFEKIREHEYYSKLNAEDPEDFRTDDGLSTTLREYLKPYALELDIKITSPDGTPVALKEFSGTANYDFLLDKCVTWKLGSSRVVTMVPSAFASFDNYIDGLPGYRFVDETVALKPEVTYNTQNIYHL